MPLDPGHRQGGCFNRPSSHRILRELALRSPRDATDVIFLSA